MSNSGGNDPFIIEAFVYRYVTVKWTKYGIFSDSIEISSVEEFMQILSGKLFTPVLNYEIIFTPEYYSRKNTIEKLAKEKKLLAIANAERNERLAKEREREAERKASTLAAQEEARQLRRGQVKSGTIPIANFDDAYDFHQPTLGLGVMGAPLLRPDNAIYAGKVTLDNEEDENLLRVKAGGYTINLFGNHHIPLYLCDASLNKGNSRFFTGRNAYRTGSENDRTICEKQEIPHGDW